MIGAAIALLLAQGATAPQGQACVPGHPAVAAGYLVGGIGPGPSGLLMAVWADGRVIRARSFGDLGGGYIAGTLDEASLRALTSMVEGSGLSTWQPEARYLSHPEVRLVTCVAGRRVVNTFTAGTAEDSSPHRVISLLHSLRLQNEAPTEVAFEEAIHWIRSGTAR